jgi:hypothetical protein
MRKDTAERKGEVCNASSRDCTGGERQPLRIAFLTGTYQVEGADEDGYDPPAELRALVLEEVQNTSP